MRITKNRKLKLDSYMKITKQYHEPNALRVSKYLI